MQTSLFKRPQMKHLLVYLFVLTLSDPVVLTLPQSCTTGANVDHPLTQCCTDLREQYHATDTGDDAKPICKEYGEAAAEITGIQMKDFELQGTIPSFEALSLLTTLNLNDNNLTGGFDGLERLTHLASLQLANNSLKTVDDVQLQSLIQLTLLELQMNEITSHTSEVWEQLTNLQYIDISSNFWNAGLPHSMMHLTNLRHFNASNNPYLYGKLRVDFENWKNIVQLDLSNCKLGGYLESSYGDHWGKIEHLDLRGNSFQDTIPDKWSGMTKLKFVDLGDNGVRGTLPSWFSTSGGLAHLDISKNQLTGQLPNLASLSSLSWLELSNNHFSGSVPNLPDISRNPNCNVKLGGNSELSCPVKNFESACPTNNDFHASYGSSGGENCGDAPVTTSSTTTTNSPNNDDDNGKLGGGYVFLIVLCVMAIIGGVGYLGWKYYETQHKYEFDYIPENS